MNFDPGQLGQLMNNIPFPIGKSNLVQLAQQHGANEQILGMLNKLPDKTFNSREELQSTLSSVGGGLGNLGNLGGFGRGQ